MQPNSNSYSPAHEESPNGGGNSNGSLGLIPTDDWRNPSKVPFEDNTGLVVGEDMVTSPTQEEIFGPIPEIPNQVGQNTKFGYYRYVSEDSIPYSESESWSQLWAELNNVNSPKSPLLLPGSHASLQSGSSSTYYSPCSDIPREEFENLRIFNVIMEDQIKRIEEVNMDADKMRKAILSGWKESSSKNESLEDYKVNKPSKGKGKAREYRKMKKFFPEGKLNPAD